ncbi:molecular chaperone DnaJ [Gammaproteobacteria bacterium LSUCC0112]|nr:molecular chaperone DnaJ [Gammaproteobacteria bacterium LSUCC0112]
MLIIRLLAPLLLALLAWWGLRNLKHRYALTTSQFRWLVGITALLLVVVILIVMGRLPIQALLAPFIFILSFMLRNVHLLIRLLPLLRMGHSKWGSNRNWGRAGNNTTPGASGIRTLWLDMSLDHQTGNMDGEILQGAFQHKKLSELTMEQLLALATACQQDADSLQLLEAYLDRMHPDWREDPAAAASSTGSQRASASDADMTEALALEILGLSAGASAEEITLAHRRLMQKLHPDRGGSDYLAQRINAARDFLLG